jgi:hypothetical protein
MNVTFHDLEKFVEDSKPKFETINSFLTSFNIFNVLGVQHREIRHSNFLGWLFDPNESHRFGDAILIELLKHIGVVDSANRSELIGLLNKNLTATKVYRESVHNIDILIVNESLGFIITIENKIYSGYSQHQLAKYFDYVEQQYSHLKTRVYLTLTPLKSDKHLDINKGNMYTNINYEDIVSILKDNKPLIDTAAPTVKESINQYISMVQKDITKTSKEIVLAKEIYKNYKKEIDFIIRNQEDFAVYKNDILEFIRSGGLEGFIISTELEKKNTLFLLPDNKDLLELFRYPEAESRGGNYIFSLVIYFEKDVVWMKFGFGNIIESEEKEAIQINKDELFNSMKVFECFNNKQLNIDYHDNTSEMEYAGICGVSLFDDDMYYAENKSFSDLFLVKFEEINKNLIQPWIEECLEKLK